MEENEQLEHKLCAVLHADVVGYSRLSEADEEGTHRKLREFMDLFSERVRSHNGNIVNFAGDAILADFNTVSDALICAIQVQISLKEQNTKLAEEQQIQFRIGVNMGEVIVDRENIYGDGVNVAARLQTLANPGGICISHTVRTAVGNKLPFHYQNIGKQTVKNIAEPVFAFQVLFDKDARNRHRRKTFVKKFGITAAIIVVLATVSYTLWTLQNNIGIGDRHAQSTALLEGRLSIAILPFINIGSDPEQEYFADGMTEDITTKISNVKGMFVISRNSAFTYKGLNVRAKQISRELGVRYLLEGSVRRAGNAVRINAQLIDGASGEHLWADIYDGTLTDIFALQDNVTSRIVDALEGELAGTELTLPDDAETVSIEAYDSFLRGWESYQRNTEEDLVKALPYFEHALALDPGYSHAYAAVAATLHKADQEDWAIGANDWLRSMRIEQNLKRAMAEPNSLSHAVAASIDIRHGRTASAIEHAERAVGMNPNDVESHLVLGRALIFDGRHPEALSILAKAMLLDPLNPSEILSLTGLARFMLKDTAAAVTVLEQARESRRDVKSGGSTVSLMSAYGHLGHVHAAARMVEEIKPLWTQLFLEYPPNLTSVMTLFPFRKQSDAKWYGSGLLHAGVCCEQDLVSVLKSKQE